MRKPLAVAVALLALAGGYLAWRTLLQPPTATPDPAPAPVTSPAAFRAAEPPAPGGPWPPARLAIGPHLAQDPPAAATIAGLEAAFREQPDDTQRVQDLAVALFQSYEFRAAKPLFEWLADRSPDPEAALGMLGMTHIRLGHLDLAGEVFDRLAARYPDSWNAHYHRGIVAFKRQRLDEAIAAFSEAVRRDPDSTFPYHDLGVCLRKAGRAAEAVEPLERANKALPDHLCIQFDLINAYKDLGRKEDADAANAAYWARRKDRGSLEPLQSTVSFEVDPADVGPVRFANVARQYGMDNHGRGRASAFVDYDLDGDLDVFTGNLEEQSRLYRNEDFGRSFTDVTDEAGLGNFDCGYGHTLADYDNDGDPDLYVARGGFQNGRPGRDANLLFRNDGGRFTDVTDAAGVGDQGIAFSAVWADFDNDGYVDLYVSNDYTANRLFRNLGDGTFADVTDAAGVGDRRATISSAIADFDDDGDLDIYVANNGDDNAVFRNDGGLRFTDISAETGMAVSGGFASVAADYDNDGRMDLYVSNMNNWHGGKDYRPGDPCYLFLNRGGWRFEEVAGPSGTAYVGGPMGLNAADYDYDGWIDLYLGNGGPAPRRWEPDVLYRNLGLRGGGLRFANVTKAAGIWNDEMGHGLSFADYDRDGDLDIYLPNGAHIDSDLTYNMFWRNEGHDNHFLSIRFVGTVSNRSAIGTRATVRSGEHVQVAEVSGGNGFGAQNSLELEFGLGQRTTVDEVAVRWPTGVEQKLVGPPVDRFLRLVEGRETWEADDPPPR